MNDINKEYLYINGFPYCIINGSHIHVIKILKNEILPYLDNGNRVLLVDELNDKYYNYEIYDHDLRRINCVCLNDLDHEHHSLYRNMF